MATFLNSTEDLTWLRDVHGIPVEGFACAILHGNEDSPEKVEVFARDHYKCKPTVFVPDENGNLKVTT